MSKWITKFLETRSPTRTDNTDRFGKKVNMSVLSVPSRGLPGENEKNNPLLLTDNTDRFRKKVNMSVLSVPSLEENLLLEEFEERLAIAQYDGDQTSAQAEKIAYQDAFIAVLADLPYEENDEKEWLQKRIKAAHELLLKQGLGKPH